MSDPPIEAEPNLDGQYRAVQDRAVQAALRAAHRVANDSKLPDRLRNDDEAPAALDQLKVPPSARPGLIQLATLVEQLRRNAKASERQTATSSPRTNETSIDMDKILLRSFDHIQWSFVVLLAMSVMVFVAGLAFLAVAIVRAAQGDTDAATFAIAGIGVADIVLIFYRRPWQDIVANLSNTQRVRVIAISYLAGVSLVRRGITIEPLEHLTNNTIALLERHAHEGRTVSDGEAGSQVS
jgi:hypothetical protein